MLVKEILYKIGIESRDDRKVKGICFNSNDISEGYIFIAKKGNNFDGNDYIKEAFNKGALCVISDSYSGINIYKSNYIDNDSKILLKEFYDINGIKIIGVTGTNGKTSTCYLLYEALTRLNKFTTYIGTLGVIDRDYKLELDNTTPEADILLQEIVKAKDRGCKYIVMEVSSHSLSLNRVDLINFDILGFTNLSQDHLDYYKNMDNYFKSKKLFFDRANKESIAIINNEDYYSNKIVSNYKGNVIRYGKNSEYEYKIISNDINGVEFEIDNSLIKSKLLFNTNIQNLVMVYLIMKQLNIDTKDIINILKKSNTVNGRSEVLYNKEYCIILDYAHTPDAMERILLEVNKIKGNRVITLFGCGGNRDKKKRPIMGYIASINSDKVYVCNDNPRNEDENEIINDIVFLIKDKSKLCVINDRKEAIVKAINELKENDILLILGKGHEEYQIIKNNKYHFSDKEIVNKCLRE